MVSQSVLSKKSGSAAAEVDFQDGLALCIDLPDEGGCVGIADHGVAPREALYVAELRRRDPWNGIVNEHLLSLEVVLEYRGALCARFVGNDEDAVVSEMVTVLSAAPDLIRASEQVTQLP